MLKTNIHHQVFCTLPFSKIKVDPEGNCTFCCFQTRKCLGNLLDSSLEEIWNSPLSKEIRKFTDNGELHQKCDVASCPLYSRKKQLSSIRFFVNEKQYPSMLELDLPIQHCNVGGENPDPVKSPACIMCERSSFFHKQDDRVLEVCDKLWPYRKFWTEVHIQGISEPFWKDYIFAVIERLGLDTESTRITTTTNGTLFTPQRLGKWLAYPLTTTTFSIDAGSPETYRKIRILNAYDKVIDALMKFASLKSPAQQLQIHNNINMYNVYEVEEMMRVAAEAKVNNISFNPTYNLGDYSVNEKNVSIFKEAQEKIEKLAKKYRVPTYFLRELTLEYQ